MSLPSLRLRRRSPAPRALRGHPWAYAGEVEEPLPEAGAGGAATLVDARGRPLGSGIFNPASKILWRRFSRDPEVAWGPAFFAPALERAASHRPAEETHQRLVWSDADDLPGLVVDRFDDVLVVQALTLGADAALETLLPLLQARWEPREILLRNDAPGRRHEGLSSECRTVSGRTLAPSWQVIDGIHYWLDWGQSQKTGFYLDQREQHRRVAAFAPGRRVLDVFCNQGSFALQAARAGAAEVVGIESSAEALTLARRNADQNGLEVDFVQDNAFDWLSGHAGHERFDLVVLDPPSFAPNRRALGGALRGHKQLHLRALQLLTPGGILATYSCSQAVTRADFLGTLAGAAEDLGRSVRVLEWTGQPADHPVRLDFPESEYLKGALLVVDA